MNDMNDWHKLSAGLEMDRVIARLLGESPRIMQEGGYDQLTGDGFAVAGWVEIYDGDELAYEQIPYRSRDLNLAILLRNTIPSAFFTLSFSPDRMNWRAEFSSDQRQSVFADASEPALAICLAWLEWKDQ